MAYGKTDASSTQAKALRKRAGAYLKKHREAAGLTQREVALACDFGYYTQVSQMETGEARVPPRSYEIYARTLGIPVAGFAWQMLKFYDPYTHKALFGVADTNPAKRKDT